MPPIWNPEETHAGVYDEVERHSEGMISFSYRPPVHDDIESVKNSRDYRILLNAPSEPCVEGDSVSGEFSSKE